MDPYKTLNDIYDKTLETEEEFKKKKAQEEGVKLKEENFYEQLKQKETGINICLDRLKKAEKKSRDYIFGASTSPQIDDKTFRNLATEWSTLRRTLEALENNTDIE
jgi:hypothetical protein